MTYLNSFHINRINIKGVDKKFIFKGENDSDLTEWFLQLKQHIILSKGANRNLAELIPIKRFWRVKFAL